LEDTAQKDITILAIDDDPLVLKIIEASLIKEKYKIVFAPDGETGLKIAAECEPDLILLDVVMPGIDGFETCAKIRRNPKLQFTPIIILTALDDRDSKIQGLEAGADDYICKPFDKIEFRARVKTIIRLNRLNRQAAINDLLTQLKEKDQVIENQKSKINELLEELRQKA
jgi:DNA-binding response OmpR family regulator